MEENKELDWAKVAEEIVAYSDLNYEQAMEIVQVFRGENDIKDISDNRAD